MENLEILTDDELRIRLHQFGFANLPVTDTTRKVLVKKLRNAIEGQKTKNRRETVAATMLSSDEEPEKKAPAKREKTPNRRATVAVAEKIKKPATSTTNGTTSRAETPSKSTSRRSAARATPAKDKVSSTGYSVVQDDTDEDVVEIPVARRSRTTTPTLGKSETVRTSYNTKVEVVAEQSTEESSNLEDEIEEVLPRKPSPVQATRRKTFTTSTSGYSSKSHESTPPRFGKASLTTSYNPRGNYKYGDDDEDEPLEINDSTAPYLSNFAKRLSTLKAEPLTSPMGKYTVRDSIPPTMPPTNYKSNYEQHYRAQPTPLPVVPRKQGGFMKAYDTLDRQYNITTFLSVIIIVMVLVMLYVVFYT